MTIWTRKTSSNCVRVRAARAGHTTHSHSLLSVATAVILERLPPDDTPREGEYLEAAIDMVVRVVLSHVMQPSATPEKTAADIAWLAACVLQT